MIDDHVHPFPLSFEPLALDALTLDVEEGEAAESRRLRLGPTRLSMEMLRARLARRLGCEQAEAVAARDDLARGDWPGYVRGLFADSGTIGMVMDAGWQGLPPGGAERFAEVSEVPVFELARFEPLVDRLIGDGAGARDVVASVDTFMEEQVARGVVGFKTVLAYRTGLAVDPGATLEEAERGLATDRDSRVPARRAGKALRDLLFRHVLGRCADFAKPLQVHTGFGDSEIRLAEANPLLLDEVLRTPAASGTDVVLIHGSYPWNEHAGYLASVRPRVWTELSLSNLFSPATTADRLLRILDVAPSGRVTVGSDGHGAPESHWFASVVLRDAWDTLCARLQGQVGERWLEETRERIFIGNSQELYGLPVADVSA